MIATPRQFWAPHAWHADRWQCDVLFTVGIDDCWSAIEAGVSAPRDAVILAGPVVPGMVNAHSHAFQRAFAGLAERRDVGHDDFWLWRDRMYQVALRITPEQQHAVARWLNIELLYGGYTQVCEFHYLHTAPDGKPYADPLAMTWPLLDAAADAGIGITLIPVVYERAGFTAPALRDDQRRFALSADDVWHAAEAIRAANRPRVASAIGIHSLRAATPQSLQHLLKLAERWNGPIHAHVAEQVGEVNDCLASTGRRPVEWLASEGVLDARWHLTHATHTTPAELDALVAAGAGIILCPTTEANLGDGVCDLPGILNRGIRIALGTDSQVSRAWTHELRALENSQRLLHRKRCVSAAPPQYASTAERLACIAWPAGVAAANIGEWGFRPGARADLLVMDPVILDGIPPAHWLDVAVFTEAAPLWRDVFVAGEHVIRNHVHPATTDARTEFARTMDALWTS